MTLSFRVVNAGRNDITTSFRTAVTVTPAGTVRQTVGTPRLAAGQCVYVTQNVRVPAEEFDVRVEADADRVLEEKDRANNTATWHYKNPTPDVGCWVSIGPSRMTVGIGSVGLLGAIAIDPKSPSTIYVGSPHGSGVWKTTDGGSSWKPVTDSFPTLAVARSPSTHRPPHAFTSRIPKGSSVRRMPARVGSRSTGTPSRAAVRLIRGGGGLARRSGESERALPPIEQGRLPIERQRGDMDPLAGGWA